MSFAAMFPKSMSADVAIVSSIIPAAELAPRIGESLTVNNEILQICSRMYSPEVQESDIQRLNDQQKLILDCIYSRHNDGFIREKHLKNILLNQTPWTTPYVVLLLGEYILEIDKLISDDLLKNDKLGLYKTFVLENPRFWEKTKARVISYWNEYYRTMFKYKEDYAGMQVVQLIEKAQN